MFRKVMYLFALVLVAAAAFAQQSADDQPPSSPFAEHFRTPQPNVPAGKVEEHTIQDPFYKKERKLAVYLPTGYDANKKDGYDLLLCFDGLSYVPADNGFALPVILDNLTAEKKIRPTVAVLLDNGMRGERLNDLANRADFAKFVAETLIPWVRKNYNVSRDPKHNSVTGYSAGGLGAANVAFFHPEIFGNVFSQSGAFWRGDEASDGAPYEWLTQQVTKSPKKPVRFYIEVGEKENMHTIGGVGPIPIEANRRFRDALVAKGYSVEYKEIPNARHDGFHWRDQLPLGLIYMLGQ